MWFLLIEKKSQPITFINEFFLTICQFKLEYLRKTKDVIISHPLLYYRFTFNIYIKYMYMTSFIVIYR